MSHPLRKKVARGVPLAEVSHKSMPEAARCNAIEVGQPDLCAGSRIEARNQVEQPLVGAIRDRDRQRFLVKSFDVAAD